MPNDVLSAVWVAGLGDVKQQVHLEQGLYRASSFQYCCLPAGRKLCQLIDWLRAGGIDREAGLIRALSRLPLPKKYTPQRLQRPAAGQPLELPDAASNLRVRGLSFVSKSGGKDRDQLSEACTVANAPAREPRE